MHPSCYRDARLKWSGLSRINNKGEEKCHWLLTLEILFCTSLQSDQPDVEKQQNMRPHIQCVGNFSGHASHRFSRAKLRVHRVRQSTVCGFKDSKKLCPRLGRDQQPARKARQKQVQLASSTVLKQIGPGMLLYYEHAMEALERYERRCGTWWNDLVGVCDSFVVELQDWIS